MEIFHPKYYEDFVCIADRCPDSCCKEWSVDVDTEAAEFYRQLPGPLGDRLREVLADSEDGTVMVIEDGRCPMWQPDGLCRIQAELGHDALCKTCRDFPRLTHDYGDFAELGLELSCPEAARLILNSSDYTMICESVSGGDAVDYDSEVMEILRRSRGEFLVFLSTTSLPLPEILAVLLLYAHEVQAELDGGDPAVLDAAACLEDARRYAQKADIGAVQKFFLELEILTPQWKTRLETAAVTPCWDRRYNALLGYLIGRYWLQAVSDYDILCRAKFAITACLLIGYLGGDLVETAQLFSKEIENDPDNVEAILDGAYTAPALTDVHLLGLLMA